MKQRIFLALFCSILFLFLLSSNNLTYAKEPSLPSVTVINPIRGPLLGLEGRDLLDSLKGQWQAVKKFDIPATWLWQYSALEEKPLVDFAKSEMKNQEFGIFLEIDKNSADKAGVTYHNSGPWYFSDGLLLVSYEQFEREKLIDNSFNTFKKTFGYYPKTVGAWWVGAESIQYMQKKYGITAVLQCADQFSTDKYSIWGTPWSIPYAPSKRNAAIPAPSLQDSIPNVVVLQWATRDPLMAYGDGVEDSIFSIQDKPEIQYIAYLKNIFLHKPLDHIAIGLESGFSLEAYAGHYQKQMEALKMWEKEGSIVLQKVSTYADAFNRKNIILPPTSYFLTTGYQTRDQAFWYHSPAYRFAIQKKGEKIYVIDVRNYFETDAEDFYTLPNTQSMIRVDTKSVIDTVRFPHDKVLLATSNKPLVVKEDNNEVFLFTDGKLLAHFTPTEVSYGTKTLSFNRSFSNTVWGLFIFMVIVYVGYIIYCYRKDVVHLMVSLFCLLLLLIVLSPIFTSGQFSSDAMLFTSQSLSFLTYFAFVQFSPYVKVALLMQILPLIALFIFHFISMKKLRAIQLLAVTLCVSFIILVFLNSFETYFYFLANFLIVGKKVKLLIIASIVVILLFILFLIKLYIKKKVRLLLILLVALGLSFVVLSHKQLFAEKNYIVTPFELAALETVFAKQKPVVYLQPETSLLNYQRVWPVLTQDKKYVEALTGTTWEIIPQKKMESVLKRKNILIFIPRYLGTDLFSIEDKKGGNKKIFDNAQIGIIETN